MKRSLTQPFVNVLKHKVLLPNQHLITNNHKPSVLKYFFQMKHLFTLILLVTSVLYTVAQNGIVINHHNTTLEDIPESWINATKSSLNIVIARTDHGSQPISGIDAITRYSTAFADLYGYNETGANNALTVQQRNYSVNDSDWATLIRNFLYTYLDCNVVVVTWENIAGQNATRYLLAMDTLISEFGPGGILDRNVQFVYTTAPHTSDVNSHAVFDSNQVIRDYCIANNRILFDLNDIEAYNPDGTYFGDGDGSGNYIGANHLGDDCSYDISGGGRGNWGIEWMTANPADQLTELAQDNVCTECSYSDGDITTGGDNSRLQCVLKGIASWHLFARLAGWSGDATNPLVINGNIYSTSGNIQSTDSIICHYELNGDATTAHVNWVKNGNSTTDLFVPFEGSTIGSLVDISGNNHSVSVSDVAGNNPLYTSNGGHNGFGAYEFDGNDYFETDATLPDSYTKMAWIYRTNSNVPTNIISSTSINDTNHFFRVDDNNLLNAGHNGTIPRVQDPTPIEENTWYHVAVTYDYDARTITLFKNGQPIDTSLMQLQYQDVKYRGVMIGCMDSAYAWQGTLDDIRIYNYALTTEQIAALYTSDSILVDEEIAAGSFWHAEVTPYSVSNYGEAYITNTLAVETPGISSLAINTHSGNNNANDSILCSFEENSYTVTTNISWLKNEVPATVLQMPFEGGQSISQNDYSGRNTSVTALGDPLFYEDLGHDGYGAMHFDGDDYFDAGNNFPTMSSYTKTAWIRRTHTNWINIISGDNVGAANSHYFKVDGDDLMLNAGHWDGHAEAEVRDNVAIVADVWYFVAVTYDYSKGILKLFKNGDLVDIDTINTTQWDVTDAGIQVGAYGNIAGWRGYMDDIRLYDFALSDDQIETMYRTDSVLADDEISGGDTWQAVLTPFSATGFGVTEVSNILEINEPRLADLTLTAHGTGFIPDSLKVNYTLDENAESAGVAWYKNGTPNSLAYYPFEGGDSTAIFDFSGNGGRGTITGANNRPIWCPESGPNGDGAFRFDGDDYIYIGEFDELYQGSYSKTAWVYRTGGSYTNILSGTEGILHDHSFRVFEDDHLRAGHVIGGGRHAEDPEVFPNDEWVFVAVTFDYESGAMILYKNGTPVDTVTYVGSERDVYYPGAQIGAINEGYGWDGYLDEVRLYGHPLSAEQIASMYHSNTAIVNAEIEGTDIWRAYVTPFSQTHAGIPELSNIISQGNPEIVSYSLNATSVNSTPNDSLFVSYTTNSDVQATVISWYKNNNPLALLNLPFEGGSISALRDFSGNERDLTLPADVNTQPLWGPDNGVDGTGGYLFDGNDYLDAGEHHEIYEGSYTKTAWVYRTGGGYNNIMSAGTTAYHNHTLLVHSDDYLMAGHNNATAYVRDPEVFQNNVWTFVAVTFDYNSGEMVLYKNGARVDRDTLTGGDRDVYYINVQIGALAGNFGWEGNIDKPQLYDYALSEAQIASLYNTDSIIVPDETSIDDSWYAVITPFSLGNVGDSVVTDSVKISSFYVTQIDNQVIDEGQSFTDIELDNYVVDFDYTDDQIVWNYHSNNELTVAITNRVASVTAPSNTWSGSENIYFVAENPDGKKDSVEVAFTVLPVNNPPVDIILSKDTIHDATTVGTTIATITTVDSDSDSFTYSLVGSGNDNGSFSISGNGLVLETSLDHLTKNKYYIEIESNDGDGGAFSKEFTLTIIGDETSVDYVEADNINIYPNPSAGILNISSEIGITGVSVYSITGTQVYFNIFPSTNSKELELEHLNNGVYILMIKADHKIITKRISISK